MTIATTDGEDGPSFCGEFHDRIRAKSGDRAPAVAERQDLKHGVSAGASCRYEPAAVRGKRPLAPLIGRSQGDLTLPMQVPQAFITRQRL